MVLPAIDLSQQLGQVYPISLVSPCFACTRRLGLTQDRTTSSLWINSSSKLMQSAFQNDTGIAREYLKLVSITL